MPRYRDNELTKDIGNFLNEGDAFDTFLKNLPTAEFKDELDFLLRIEPILQTHGGSITQKNKQEIDEVMNGVLDLNEASDASLVEWNQRIAALRVEMELLALRLSIMQNDETLTTENIDELLSDCRSTLDCWITQLVQLQERNPFQVATDISTHTRRRDITDEQHILIATNHYADDEVFFSHIGLRTFPGFEKFYEIHPDAKIPVLDKKLLTEFPQYKIVLLDKILSFSAELLAKYIDSQDVVRDLLDAYPELEHRDKIYQKMIECGHWKFLVRLADFFPNHDLVVLLPDWDKSENCQRYRENCFIVRSSRNDARRGLNQFLSLEQGGATDPDYHKEKLHISIATDDYEKTTGLLIPLLLKYLDVAIGGFKHTDARMLSVGLLSETDEERKCNTKRLLSGDQFTLYFPYDAFDQDKILEMCKEINDTLIENDIKPGVHAPAELPLSPYLSFRLEQFEGKRFDPTLFSVNRETAVRFYAIQSESALYKFLSKNLDQKSVSSAPTKT